MNWIGRDWGPRADIEAGAKAGPFLIREKAIVDRYPRTDEDIIRAIHGSAP